MATRFAPSRAKLADCQRHGAGSGAELLLVEGESAAQSVAAVRDENLQAVLPLQGKPLNAWAAPMTKVRAHGLFRQLADALGLDEPTALPPGAATRLRFDRIALLFDPDADGIHIGALMLLYFQRWLPGLIEDGRVWMVRAPMFELIPRTRGADGPAAARRHAYNPQQCRELAEALRAEGGGAEVRVQAFRGLGSIAPELLRSLCVDPSTRVAHAVSAREVQAVIEVFGGAA
jgi:DNA gyrase subunit B